MIWNEEKAVSYSHGKIKYNSIYSLLIYVQILFVVFYRLLLQYGAPSSITYITDIINGLLFFGILKGHNRIGRFRRIIFIYLCLLIWGLLGATIYGLSIPLYLWSMRNNIRFIVFAMACVYYLKMGDFKSILNLLQNVMPLQTALVLFQYFVLHYNGDYLGGIFGTVMGANLYVNLYMTLVFSYTVICYLRGKNKFKNLVAITIQIILVAVLSELKFIFVEIIIIAAVAWIISKKDSTQLGKAILIIAAGYIVISVSLPYLYKLYPDFEDFMNLDFIFAVHEQGYSMSGDLDRLSAIPIITRKIFQNTPLRMIFGIGLGNAEYSSISFLCSQFYKQYGFLHYTWFSDAMMYLETGFVGIALYVLSFITILFEALKKFRSNIRYAEIDGTIAVMCIMSMILVIYNQTLRTEAAYLLYFVFAATFVKHENGVEYQDE